MMLPPQSRADCPLITGLEVRSPNCLIRVKVSLSNKLKAQLQAFIMLHTNQFYCQWLRLGFKKVNPGYCQHQVDIV